MNPTKNDLSENKRLELTALLNLNLAVAIDVSLQAKQAHWNVKGPHFIALHELFDKVAEAVENGVDELAERCVQLGGTAEGTLQAVGKRSQLKPYPLNATTGTQHVQLLSDALAFFGKSLPEGIEAATGLGDADTADLFTELSREADKYLWFVEAHLQA